MTIIYIFSYGNRLNKRQSSLLVFSFFFFLILKLSIIWEKILNYHVI
jgi:hypothetical protein